MTSPTDRALPSESAPRMTDERIAEIRQMSREELFHRTAQRFAMYDLLDEVTRCHAALASRATPPESVAAPTLDDDVKRLAVLRERYAADPIVLGIIEAVALLRQEVRDTRAALAGLAEDGERLAFIEKGVRDGGEWHRLSGFTLTHQAYPMAPYEVGWTVWDHRTDPMSDFLGTGLSFGAAIDAARAAVPLAAEPEVPRV